MGVERRVVSQLRGEGRGFGLFWSKVKTDRDVAKGVLGGKAGWGRREERLRKNRPVRIDSLSTVHQL